MRVRQTRSSPERLRVFVRSKNRQTFVRKYAKNQCYRTRIVPHMNRTRSMAWTKCRHCRLLTAMAVNSDQAGAAGDKCGEPTYRPIAVIPGHSAVRRTEQLRRWHWIDDACVRVKNGARATLSRLTFQMNFIHLKQQHIWLGPIRTAAHTLYNANVLKLPLTPGSIRFAPITVVPCKIRSCDRLQSIRQC
jgi:hypothetical protein